MQECKHDLQAFSGIGLAHVELQAHDAATDCLKEAATFAQDTCIKLSVVQSPVLAYMQQSNHSKPALASDMQARILIKDNARFLWFMISSIQFMIAVTIHTKVQIAYSANQSLAAGRIED